MITLEYAINLAERTTGKIDSISDCGDRWVFDFFDEKYKFGTVSMFVFKKNGKFEYFSRLMEEYQEILKNSKPISL